MLLAQNKGFEDNLNNFNENNLNLYNEKIEKDTLSPKKMSLKIMKLKTGIVKMRTTLAFLIIMMIIYLI